MFTDNEDNTIPMEFTQEGEDDHNNIVTKENPLNNVEKIKNLRSVEEISTKYRSVFEFPFFNIIQSNVMDDVLYSDTSLVISAPTGSGKTAIFELAIIQLLMRIEENNYKDEYKIVYVAPVKALCTERMVDWHKKFSPFGLNCAVITSDTDNFDYLCLENLHIILTTPEKWDTLTRKWKDNRKLIEVVKLFMIDEVHLLNEESRGSILEVIVSRMKIIQDAIRYDAKRKNCSDDSVISKRIRFMAVSATIPNIEDIAEWLGGPIEPAIYYKISDELRPVKLNKVVLGYPCGAGMTAFKFDMSLMYKLRSIIMQYAHGKPILIFCSTRKSVEMTSLHISQNMTFHLSQAQKNALVESSIQMLDNKMKTMLVNGVGCHHAGMSADNRLEVENLFRSGNLPILVTTSTLAMGVNLPAHLVIIKSTQQYMKGEYKEYSEGSLLQMIGRAGRPQYDTSATAVIMTKSSEKERYEKLIKGTELIESNLHRHLKEHINAEVVLHTITDIAVALDWLRSTFLYIRAIKNPKYYKIPANYTREKIEKKLQDMCQIEMNGLARYGMLEIDQNDGFNVKPTITGTLMARYYMAFETMKTFLEVKGHESLSQILMLVSKCHEFSEMFLRVNEKRTLNTLNHCKNQTTIRFPLPGKINTIAMKVNCLFQAVFGCLHILDPSLAQEAIKVMPIGERISKCLAEYLQKKNKCFRALCSTVTLAKCFHSKLWENSIYVSCQLKGIGKVLSSLLASSGKITFKMLLDTNPRDLERIMNRHAPMGNNIQEEIAHLPLYTLELNQSKNTLQVEIVISLLNYDKIKVRCTTGNKSCMYLLVGDTENNILLFKKIYHHVMATTEKCTQYVDCISHTEHDVVAYLISENWVGIDCEEKIQIQSLNTNDCYVTKNYIKPKQAIVTRCVVNQRIPLPLSNVDLINDTDNDINLFPNTPRNSAAKVISTPVKIYDDDDNNLNLSVNTSAPKNQNYGLFNKICTNSLLGKQSMIKDKENKKNLPQNREEIIKKCDKSLKICHPSDLNSNNSKNIIGKCNFSTQNCFTNKEKSKNDRTSMDNEYISNNNHVDKSVIQTKCHSEIINENYNIDNDSYFSETQQDLCDNNKNNDMTDLVPNDDSMYNISISESDIDLIENIDHIENNIEQYVEQNSLKIHLPSTSVTKCNKHILKTPEKTLKKFAEKDENIDYYKQQIIEDFSFLKGTKISSYLDNNYVEANFKKSEINDNKPHQDVSHKFRSNENSSISKNIVENYVINLSDIEEDIEDEYEEEIMTNIHSDYILNLNKEIYCPKLKENELKTMNKNLPTNEISHKTLSKLNLEVVLNNEIENIDSFDILRSKKDKIIDSKNEQNLEVSSNSYKLLNEKENLTDFCKEQQMKTNLLSCTNTLTEETKSADREDQTIVDKYLYKAQQVVTSSLSNISPLTDGIKETRTQSNLSKTENQLNSVKGNQNIYDCNSKLAQNNLNSNNNDFKFYETSNKLNTTKEIPANQTYNLKNSDFCENNITEASDILNRKYDSAEKLFLQNNKLPCVQEIEKNTKLCTNYSPRDIQNTYKEVEIQNLVQDKEKNSEQLSGNYNSFKFYTNPLKINNTTFKSTFQKQLSSLENLEVNSKDRTLQKEHINHYEDAVVNRDDKTHDDVDSELMYDPDAYKNIFSDTEKFEEQLFHKIYGGENKFLMINKRCDKKNNPSSNVDCEKDNEKSVGYVDINSKTSYTEPFVYNFPISGQENIYNNNSYWNVNHLNNDKKNTFPLGEKKSNTDTNHSEWYKSKNLQSKDFSYNTNRWNFDKNHTNLITDSTCITNRPENVENIEDNGMNLYSMNKNYKQNETAHSFINHNPSNDYNCENLSNHSKDNTYYFLSNLYPQVELNVEENSVEFPHYSKDICELNTSELIFENIDNQQPFKKVRFDLSECPSYGNNVLFFNNCTIEEENRNYLHGEESNNELDIDLSQFKYVPKKKLPKLAKNKHSKINLNKMFSQICQTNLSNQKKVDIEPRCEFLKNKFTKKVTCSEKLLKYPAEKQEMTFHNQGGFIENTRSLYNRENIILHSLKQNTEEKEHAESYAVTEILCPPEKRTRIDKDSLESTTLKKQSNENKNNLKGAKQYIKETTTVETGLKNNSNNKKLVQSNAFLNFVKEKILKSEDKSTTSQFVNFDIGVNELILSFINDNKDS